MRQGQRNVRRRYTERRRDTERAYMCEKESERSMMERERREKRKTRRDIE